MLLLLFVEFKNKGGIIIENRVLKLKELMNNEDKEIIKEILDDILHLGIKEIEYDKNIQLSNISEYEFELVKVKAILKSNEEVEMYLKMIKNSKIKESIFCYWCTIYEEELFKTKEIENMVNKVLISELDKTKYKSRVFLTIENNKTQILETGTEVNFIEIASYIEEMQNERNQFEKLYKYFEQVDDYVLLVGIKCRSKEE